MTPELPSATRSRRKLLNDLAARTAAPRMKAWKLWDTDGLHLLVQPTGAKWWRFDYRFLGRRKTISFGVYPTVSLAAAREKRREARERLQAGEDPSRARQVAKLRAQASTADTFAKVALEWQAAKARTYAPATRTKVTILLTRHLLPHLGPLPIAAITPRQVLTVLRLLERADKIDTMHRVKEIASMIFRYAVGEDLVERDPTGDLRGLLRPLQHRHHAAVTEPAAVGALLRAISALRPGVVKHAMQLAPYVFVRPGELRLARWTEIDLEAALWRIPAARTKTRAEHLVPLARQAVALLRAAQEDARDSVFVFPSPRSAKRPLSNMAMTAALRTMGYEHDVMTPHGFRAMARTLLDERLRFHHDVIELQLAHTVPGTLGATYNRAKHLEERTRMMQVYADYLDELRAARTAAIA
jgi:integrase